MKETMSPDIKELMETVHYRPAVSIILPFEPKMNGKAELLQRLKFAGDKVEKEIRQNYVDDLSRVVIQKLRKIIKELNFSTYKKSIAIYVSPLFEKVLYLDIPVEDRITIDESFGIRDLIYAKKEMHKYLVLALSSKTCKAFVGNTTSLVKIKSNVPDHIAAFANDLPERVGGFSDPSARKEIDLNRFMEQSDKGLGFLLESYSLPVFVVGAKRVLGHFKHLTKHEKNIVGYVHGNYEEASDAELESVLQPYINDWKKVRMEDLRLQLERAADAGRLTTGVRNVWRETALHKGRLLVVDKKFTYPVENIDGERAGEQDAESLNKFPYIRDAIDDMIEKVLEYGGDVEFVDGGVLKGEDPIALIRYY